VIDGERVVLGFSQFVQELVIHWKLHASAAVGVVSVKSVLNKLLKDSVQCSHHIEECAPMLLVRAPAVSRSGTKQNVHNVVHNIFYYVAHSFVLKWSSYDRR